MARPGDIILPDIKKNGQVSVWPTGLSQDAGCMDLFEDKTHSFIVKIWLEETAEEAGKAYWRGHITHVPSGARQYVQTKRDITDFIDIYLARMGIETDG